MKEEKENYVVGYKGLKNDLSSKHNPEFKYELNKRYKLNPENQELKLCKTGYHFCRNKDDVFNFYEIDGINNHRYFEIRAYGNIIDEINIGGIPKKSVTDEIEIVKEISLQEFISSLDINYVRINNKIPENIDLSTCKNLKSLEILNCDSLKNLPEILPENLKFLEINNCGFLKNLPENLPENLEILKINNCGSLENLPEDLPENLEYLQIWDCNSLKKLPEILPKNLKIFKI